jgi:ssDNA-binding Zn-finger/Zn-ribbon topoisomerase 1
MYEFLSLRVKCPICNELLMDEEHLVDNEASIKLNIEMGDKTGTIFLSSIYGSYNYICDIDLPSGGVASFICTHCHAQITSQVECLTCGASMVPFYLEMGGKVAICSRAGCKNHAVEFTDLSDALKRLYQEYGFRGRNYPKPEERPVIKAEKKEDEFKEIIESGTLLQTYCPHCLKSLIEDDMIKLDITNENNEEGVVMLSPYLNVFTSKSTVFLKEHETLKDLKCPHCHKSLKMEEKHCDWCGSPIAKINITARTKFIDFYICTKKGCRWHGLSDDDLYDIKIEDSLEW